MNLYTAIGALIIVTVLTSFCADNLVGAIDEFAKDFDIPKAFIGLILLPIVGNACRLFGFNLSLSSFLKDWRCIQNLKN